MKLIEKREEEIKNIKNLDKKFSNFNIYLNFEDESDTKNMLNTKDVIVNKNEIEDFAIKAKQSVNVGVTDFSKKNEIKALNKKITELVKKIKKMEVEVINIFNKIRLIIYY